MATSVTTPTFTGQSTYSADFQQVLSRAVSIASLPMQTLQNSVSTLQSQQSALVSLQTDFTSLQNDIGSINAATQGSPAAQSSQSSSVSASVSSGAMPGTYSINVTEIGSSTSTLSQAGSTTVTDPTTGNISSADSFTLTVDGTKHTVKPSGSSLEDLATAINTSGASVQATVVNVGSSSSPDYRLSVSSTNLGPDTIQLNDGTNNLLNTLSTGTYSQYEVNGSGNTIQGTSNQVTLSPGVTVNLLAATSGSATITVSNNFTGLSSALQTFTTDYNQAVSDLNQHVGQAGGALSGQSIIYTLKSALQSLTQYSSGGGSVASLNDLGLSLDQNGVLSFNASALTSANTSAVQQFLGSTTTSGFLNSASNTLSAFNATSAGTIEAEINTAQDTINSENDQITADQTRINDMTNSLEANLTAADAAIATLQSQVTYFTDLFQAQYSTNSNG